MILKYPHIDIKGNIPSLMKVLTNYSQYPIQKMSRMMCLNRKKLSK
jgi:hypothetical protein